MKAHHEHEFEAALGLPERLPRNEYVIWQGQPNWKQLAVDAFHVRKILLYFAVMVGLQLAHLLEGDTAALDIVKQIGTSVLLASLALGLLVWSAYLSGQATIYTLTNRRIVMRIGIVLSLTFNLPLKKIVSCDLMALKNQIGNIAIGISSDSPIGWLNLWPHVRAWRIHSPQPTLRCIANAEQVGQMILHAWRQECPTEQLVSVSSDTQEGTSPSLSHA
jgi:hypothetical protein